MIDEVKEELAVQDTPNRRPNKINGSGDGDETSPLVPNEFAHSVSRSKGTMAARSVLLYAQEERGGCLLVAGMWKTTTIGKKLIETNERSSMRLESGS